METTTRLESPSTLLLTLSEVATHLRCTRRSVERARSPSTVCVWSAWATPSGGLDERPVRKHLSRATKSELERGVRDLERSRDAGTTTWSSSDSTLT
jgi:hypothetical protein